MPNKKYITEFLNICLLIFAISFIINPSFGRTVFYVISVLWILEGNFKQKLEYTLKQKTIIYFLLMILVFILSIYFSNRSDQGFWAEKFSSGYGYLSKEKYFLISLMIATSLQIKYIRYLMLSYILQIAYIVTYSFGIKFSLFRGDKYSSVYEPVVFMDHTHYSIAVALGIVLAVYFLLKEKRNSVKTFYLFISVYFLINIYIIGGRLGQIGVLVSIFFMLLYYFLKLKKKKLIMISSIFIIMIAVIPYFTSNIYKQRMDLGLKNIIQVYEKNNFSTSWGVRIGFDIISFDYITSSWKHFLFGAGMGDAKSEIHNFILKHHKDKKVLLKFEHVHNQFFQNWINGGLLGVVFFIMIFYSLYKLKVPLEERVLILGVIALYTIDGSANLIFHRIVSLEIFAIAIGLLLAFERVYTQKQLLSQT